MCHVSQSHVCIMCDRAMYVSCVTCCPTFTFVSFAKAIHVMSVAFNYECQNVICCRLKCLPRFKQSSTYSSISEINMFHTCDCVKLLVIKGCYN